MPLNERATTRSWTLTPPGGGRGVQVFRFSVELSSRSRGRVSSASRSWQQRPWGGRMAAPDWAPPGIDPERPSAARMWDYLLGGAHNFAADRAVAEQAIAYMPQLPELA